MLLLLFGGDGAQFAASQQKSAGKFWIGECYSVLDD